MFKVNNKDTRTTSLAWRCSSVIVVNIEHIYFTPFSSVSIGNFGYVIAGWVSQIEEETVWRDQTLDDSF